MPFNLLLLPLVGGYYFLITCRLTKYIHQRIDRQKLIFNAVLIGILLLGLAVASTKAVEYGLPIWSEEAKQYIPLQLPYTGTAILSLLLGFALPHLLNRFINDTKALSRSIKLTGNELEQLVREAFLNASLVSFTMKSGKIYVGWPISLPRPSSGAYLSVLPLISGYRNDTQDVVFTTEYWDVYQARQQAGEQDVYEGFQLILSISEITSANLFNLRCVRTVYPETVTHK